MQCVVQRARLRRNHKESPCVEKRLLVVNGHPDPRPERFCAALSDAYELGANTGGWETRRLDVGGLALSSVASPKPCNELPPDMMGALGDIHWSSQLAIVFPLWFDQPPAILRALFDQLSRSNSPPRFSGANNRQPARMARIVVTMEMPAFIYRALYRLNKAPGCNNQTLSFPGIHSDEPILIGSVHTISNEQRQHWLEATRLYAEQGALAPLFPIRKYG